MPSLLSKPFRSRSNGLLGFHPTPEISKAEVYGGRQGQGRRAGLPTAGSAGSSGGRSLTRSENPRSSQLLPLKEPAPS